MAINIFLADDHAIVRDGLRSLFDGHGEYHVVGEAADGRTAVDRVCALEPDVLIIDIGMPELNGIDATRKIVAALPRIIVIALSMHADLDFVVEMLSAGARGYLLKESAFDELHTAIQVAMQGQHYLSRQIDTVVIKEFARNYKQRDNSPIAVLAPREREVLQLLAEGYSNKEVSSRLGITVRSVETYRAQIMNKLDLHSMAALTKYAVRAGLTSL